MVDELRIKVTADTSGFKKGMDNVNKSFEKARKSAQKAQDATEGAFGKDASPEASGNGSGSRFDGIKEGLGQASPMFKSLSDGWDECMDLMNKDGEKGFSLMKLVGVTAIAGLAAQALQTFAQMGKAIINWAKECSTAWDSVRTEKATAKMNASIRKMKTAIGSIAAPLYEMFSKIVSALADGVTWIVEGFMNIVAFLQGLLGLGGRVNETLEGTSGAAQDASEAAEAGLASFDKLNTLDTSGMGDADEMEKIQEMMDKTRKDGAELHDAIKELFSFDFLDDLDLGGLWDGFVETLQGLPGMIVDGLGGAWDWVCEKAGGVWKTITEWAGGLWDGFTEWAGEAWDTICETAGEIWDTICGFAEDLWDSFTEWAGEAWDGIVTKATEIWDTIKETVTNFWADFTTKMGEAWDGVVTKATEIWETIKTKIKEVWDAFTGWMGDAWNSCVTKATEIWESIKTKVKEVWDGIKQYVIDKWTEIKTKIVNIFTEAWNKVKAAFDTVLGPIKSTIEWLKQQVDNLLGAIDKAKNAVGNAVGKVTDTVGGLWNGFKETIGLAADGAVVEPNDPHPVIVGDNTREREIISPLSTMKQAFREVMGEGGAYSARSASSGQPVEVTFKLDSRVLARLLVDPLDAEYTRRGMNA